MSTPGGLLDLTLPDYAALRTMAGQDPDEELARLTSAAPQQISGAAQAFRTGGEHLGTAWEQSLSAQEQIGASYRVDGDPVYDRAVHLAALPPEFADASDRMLDVAGRLGVIGEELAERTHLAQQRVQRPVLR